jgi:hypothetical protein
MNQPTDPFKATLDHVPDTTGRDGAIDFAAKVEASHAERVVLDHGEDFIAHAGEPIELTAAGLKRVVAGRPVWLAWRRARRRTTRRGSCARLGMRCD